MFPRPFLAASVRVTARRCWALAFLGLAAALSSRPAQAQAPVDTTFQHLLRQNQFSLTQTGARFSGPGWDKLEQDIRKSTLVLVGEDHGLAQIPAFTTAVADVLLPKVYVAEIDRYQARDLTRLAAQPGLPTAFARQYPMDLSFYSWAEEFELIRHLRRQQVPIVGLEQVGGATPGRLFGLMAEQVKSKATRTYLRQLAATSQARDRADMVAGTYTQTTVNTIRPATLDSLRRFLRPESHEARQMLEELATSAAIFQTNAAGQPGGHKARINLMKRNLLMALPAYQQPGQPLPTMLFKFGAYHLGRGRSIWGDMYDVGSLVTSLADAYNQKSLHVFIIGKQGQKIEGANPDDFTKNAASYSNADADMVLPFMAATPAGSAWQVFDVRPLRRAMLYKGLKVDSPELEATILGYDYVVIIPETTASHNF